MSDEFEPDEVDARLQRLFAALPRESAPELQELGALVTALKAEGFLRRRGRRFSWVLQIAAAVMLLALGGIAGARIASRNSLEAMLARTDLSLSDRILLMQRAGSAYVRAANAYASAASQTDSTAIEVSSRVLIGAAQAVARSKLDGGLTPSLTAALRATAGEPAPVSRQRIIWF
jgi:hypothetical protein